jgi:hypothetical protein
VNPGRFATLAFAVAAIGCAAACGLSGVGLQESDGGEPGTDAATDATLDDAQTGDVAMGEVSTSDTAADVLGTDAPHDAHPSMDAPADSPTMNDAGVCLNTPASCGAPGACADCSGSSNGAACVGGACGCNTSGDCPALEACQANHVCSSACGGAQTCNGGCCSGATCVAVDNNHCGAACTLPRTVPVRARAAWRECVQRRAPATAERARRA